MGVGRDIPSIIYGEQADYKKLYYSDPNAALKVPIKVGAGFGKLEMGTVLAINTSAAGGINECIPYDPTATITGAEVAQGRAYLVQNSGASSVTLYVTIEDSYRFQVGDDLYVVDSDGEGTAENLGKITAISRTTYAHMAVITVTTQTVDNFTTAKFAYVCHEGFNTAKGVLEKSVDTGTGENAKGALATLILGNCVLYSAMLTNMDSAARTDLSAGTWGIYTYIR